MRRKVGRACQLRSMRVRTSDARSYHAGATGIPLHWALHTDKRAVCLRFTPEDRSNLSAPWSHSVQVGQAGKADQHVAIPVRVPSKDQQGKADLPLSQPEPSESMATDRDSETRTCPCWVQDQSALCMCPPVKNVPWHLLQNLLVQSVSMWQAAPACTQVAALPLTAIPQPVASSTCLHAGDGKGGDGGYLRLVSTLQTGTGPAFELHGPRVAKRIRHAHQ